MGEFALLDDWTDPSRHCNIHRSRSSVIGYTISSSHFMGISIWRYTCNVCENVISAFSQWLWWIIQFDLLKSKWNHCCRCLVIKWNLWNTLFHIRLDDASITLYANDFLTIRVFIPAKTIAYYNLIGYSLAHSSTECRYRVQYGFDEIENMIANNQTTELQKALNLCDPIDTNSEYEIAMLLERFIEMIAQYIDLFQLVNFKEKFNYELIDWCKEKQIFVYSFQGIQNFCHHIDNPSLTPLESLIRWTRFVYETDSDCFDFGYKSTVERYSNTQQSSKFFWLLYLSIN